MEKKTCAKIDELNEQKNTSFIYKLIKTESHKHPLLLLFVFHTYTQKTFSDQKKTSRIFVIEWRAHPYIPPFPNICKLYIKNKTMNSKTYLKQNASLTKNKLANQKKNAKFVNGPMKKLQLNPNSTIEFRSIYNY